MIMGYPLTMEDWDPRFVDALGRHYRVVIFDNAGIGDTRQLPGPLTIDAMARQTGALMATLRLTRPAVLGWSMGGMIAQALAVLDPSQVSRLVLCATFPGTGGTVPSATTRALTRLAPQQVKTVLFPPNQAKAYNAYVAAISGYPPAAAQSKAVMAAQRRAVIQWWIGKDPVGRKIAAISVPTLIADGTGDWVDPTASYRADHWVVLENPDCWLAGRAEGLIDQGEAILPRGGIAQPLHQPSAPPAQGLLDGYNGVVELAHSSEQRQRCGRRQLDLHPVLVAAELCEGGAGLITKYEGPQ